MNPNATCAGPTRPTGASCNPADKPLERRDGERTGAADRKATPASTKAREVDGDGVETAGKGDETAERARGQGASAEGPSKGAEDEVARGEGAIAVDSQGASGDNEVGRVYAQPTDTCEDEERQSATKTKLTRTARAHGARRTTTH